MKLWDNINLREHNNSDSSLFWVPFHVYLHANPNLSTFIIRDKVVGLTLQTSRIATS